MNCDPPTWVSTSMFVIVGVFFLGIIVSQMPWAIRNMLEEWDDLIAFLRRRGE